MTQIVRAESGFNDVLLLRLAREIAMDIRPLEDILPLHGLSPQQWDKISNSEKFQEYLRQFVAEWGSAVNTEERVRMKSMAFVEESLPEFYARAHDPKEALNHKIEVLKTIARFAGIGGSVDGSLTGDRLSVTINLGADQQVRIEKNVSPSVIEGDYL